MRRACHWRKPWRLNPRLSPPHLPPPPFRMIGRSERRGSRTASSMTLGSHPPPPLPPPLRPQDDWKKQEESKPHCLIYDPLHRRVLTAVNRPYVWSHKMVTQVEAPPTCMTHRPLA